MRFREYHLTTVLSTIKYTSPKISDQKTKKSRLTMTNQSLINVGIAGLGRTGWNNHANACAHLPEQFRVVAVCDPDPARQAEAIERFDCLAYSSYEEIVADKAVELMVVATPSNLHAEQTIAAMRARQHVIVEKPMASDLAGADAMLAAAKETGQILTVHQNLRYAADFVKVREVIASGVLGRIIEVRIHNGGFDRRWDWQTMKRYGGGMLNNSGPHFVDMGMLLIDDPNRTSSATWKPRRSTPATPTATSKSFSNPGLAKGRSSRSTSPPPAPSPSPTSSFWEREAQWPVTAKKRT